MTDIFSSGFDKLEAGDGFTTYGRTVTESDLTAFAGLTGDHHPLHTDAEWASESRFEGRIAHGMLLLSYAVGLAPIDPERVVALRGFDRVVFKRPVHIGDTITLTGKVESVRPLDTDTGMVGLQWRLLNQNDQLVVRANVEIVWRRGETGRNQPADSSPRSAQQSTTAAEAQAGPEPVYL